jgi:hypothetical protein
MKKIAGKCSVIVTDIKSRFDLELPECKSQGLPFQPPFIGAGMVKWQICPLLKNAVFWDGMPCGSYKNRRFGGT